MIEQLWNIIKLVSFFIYAYLRYIFDRDNKQFINSVATYLSKQNMLYIKMFQAIALNKNLLNDAMSQHLLKYSDNVDYTEEDLDEPSLREIMQKYNLTAADPIIPINSGMIALVYKLKTNLGSDVILKIKRNNIDIRLMEDINKLQGLLHTLSAVPFFKYFCYYIDIPAIVKNNIDFLVQQTDFTREVENIQLMKNKCRYLKYVVIPSVYTELTHYYPNAILMEYIHGKKLEQVDKEDYLVYAKLNIKFGFACCFNFGLAHGDLHNGNILFIKEEDDVYKLGILDYGILYRFDEAIKNKYTEIFAGLFCIDETETAKKLLGVMFEPEEELKSIDPIVYNKMVSILSTNLSSLIRTTGSADQLQLHECLKNMTEFLKTCNYGDKIHINDTFIKLQLVVAMSHGITMSLCGDTYKNLTREVLDEMLGKNSDIFKHFVST
jgi:predicted unusual protein kinase regulating ubiquinone biosynthesis (AarF/ABC1/UbiB family)